MTRILGRFPVLLAVVVLASGLLGLAAAAAFLAHGLPLYVEPGPDFVPYIYPPGY